MADPLHTPTPWEVDAGGRIHRLGGDRWGGLIKIVSPWQEGAWDDDAEARANAEFIVRACNAHDDLLAALKPFAAKVHHDGVEAPYPEEEWVPLLDAAARAVAKAEGR